MNGLNFQQPSQDPNQIIEQLMRLMRDAGYSGGLSDLLNSFLKRGGRGRGSLIEGQGGLAGTGLNFGGGGGEAGGGISFTETGGGGI